MAGGSMKLLHRGLDAFTYLFNIRWAQIDVSIFPGLIIFFTDFHYAKNGNLSAALPLYCIIHDIISIHPETKTLQPFSCIGYLLPACCIPAHATAACTGLPYSRQTPVQFCSNHFWPAAGYCTNRNRWRKLCLCRRHRWRW